LAAKQEENNSMIDEQWLFTIFH